MDYYYTSGDEYLSDSEVNTTFSKLLYSSDKDFELWVDKVSKKIKYQYDKNDKPIILGGGTTADMVKDFKKLSDFDCDSLVKRDDLTNKSDCLSHRGSCGFQVNNFFPNMWMTTDGSSSHKNLYTILTHKDFRQSRITSFRRHFKRDGFYQYSSQYAVKNDAEFIKASSGVDWIKRFHDKKKKDKDFKNYDIWFEYQKTRSNLKHKLTISKRQIKTILSEGYIGRKHLKTIESKSQDKDFIHKWKDFDDTDRFYIRVFDKTEKVFSRKSRNIFRMGFSLLPPNQFPPVIAKYIYQKFTSKLKNEKRIVIYDPSSGWGGRIIGACSASSDRPLHYVGTDPNMDNYIDALGISRYEYVASFYKRNVVQPNHLTYELFQSGSELIHKNPKFKKYKNKIDLVFTSPPYFNAEGYSTDETQSCIKFPEYEGWRDGFLRPTLETCVEYLKSGGYLLWNIADIKSGQSMYPLESDSKQILNELGLKYVEKIKFVLTSAPGKGRVSWVHRNPQTKNFVSLNGKFSKYEPIFVFKKK
tara:strand:+ start:2798 stop:4381 length:1584 start_codon:yes stop_codon:yes gene_type:complete